MAHGPHAWHTRGAPRSRWVHTARTTTGGSDGHRRPGRQGGPGRRQGQGHSRGGGEVLIEGARSAQAVAKAASPRATDRSNNSSRSAAGNDASRNSRSEMVQMASASCCSTGPLPWDWPPSPLPEPRAPPRSVLLLLLEEVLCLVDDLVDLGVQVVDAHVSLPLWCSRCAPVVIVALPWRATQKASDPSDRYGSGAAIRAVGPVCLGVSAQHADVSGEPLRVNRVMVRRMGGLIG